MNIILFDGLEQDIALKKIVLKIWHCYEIKFFNEFPIHATFKTGNYFKTSYVIYLFSFQQRLQNLTNEQTN